MSNVYKIFVENFNKNIFTINEKSTLSYLRSNKNIFDPIFAEILGLEYPDVALVAGEAITDSRDIAEDYIDETSEEGRQKIKTAFNIRKRQARIQGGYRCALETINNCRPVYFTAKATKKNYLELHHLIPKEFRNDFSHSIEVLANYITLCPRCHRQIHLAVDRERKCLINALFKKRKDRLKIVGLNLTLSEIYEYYKINS